MPSDNVFAALVENLDVTRVESHLIDFLRGEPLAPLPWSSVDECLRAYRDASNDDVPFAEADAELIDEQEAYRRERERICLRLRAFLDAVEAEDAADTV